MGPVNWIAVVVAALTAGALALAWFGPAFGPAKTRKVAAGRVMTRGALPHRGAYRSVAVADGDDAGAFFRARGC